MGKLRTKVKNWAIQKAVEFDPKFLLPKKLTKKQRESGATQSIEKPVLYEEPKLDGLRGIVIVQIDEWAVSPVSPTQTITVKAYTSNGARVINAKYLCKEIAARIEELVIQCKFRNSPLLSAYGSGFVIDGEFYYKNWNETNSLVMTETLLPHANKLTINAFDIVSLADWKWHECRVRLINRKRILSLIIKELQLRTVKLLPYLQYTYTTPAAHKKHLAMRVAEGVEGFMLKPCNGLYRFKKSRDWMKVKPVYTVDLKIVDALLGTEGKRNGKRLGRLIVEGKIGKKKIRTRCGGGFKDKDRDLLWKMHLKGKLVGRTVEVLFDNITVGAAVRFPRFVRLRLDK